MKINKIADVKISPLIKLILLTVLIVVVIIGLLKLGLIEQLKDLFPDFKDDEVRKPKDFEFCPIEIAEIKGDFIYMNGINTNLFWYGKAGVKLNENPWKFEGRDEDVGTIDNREISIIKSWYYSGEYEKHPKMPSLDNLRLLDGSYRPNEYDVLCRETEITSLKQGGVVDLENIPKGWKLAEGSNLKDSDIQFLDENGAKIFVKKETGEIIVLLFEYKPGYEKNIEVVWIEVEKEK